VISAVPGLKPKGSGRFFYPRRGYGQISEAYAAAASQAGAEIRLNARVQGVTAGGGFRIDYTQDGKGRSLAADYVWSTIPITTLARSLVPRAPQALLEAADATEYRAMLLIYLVVGQEHFSEYDAHYFPGADIPISRLSEPKHYAGRGEPRDLTVLCAELPCSVTDPEWQQSDAELGQLVCRSLERAGIPVQGPVRQVVTRRLKQAYPIYRQGYETAFGQLDDWIGGVDGLLTFGRQGLFAHDNTHHALYMAYAAVECLEAPGRFNRERWQAYRQEFATHVVED
jgi:protoporphyrinogen oxidase